MSMLESLILSALRKAGRACAAQLARMVDMALCEVYAALVQLEARGLAWFTSDKEAIPGFGRARYWMPA